MAEYCCSWCGKKFLRKTCEIYCSDECRAAGEKARKRAWSRTNYWKNDEPPIVDGLYQRTCIQCGKTFLSEDYRPRICSEECRRARYNYLKAKRNGSAVPKERPQNTIVEVAVEARKSGISYGQMMARRYENG